MHSDTSFMDPTNRIDFATLKRARTPNTFLMAPEGLCKQSKIDVEAPVFASSPTKLRQEFLRLAIAKPRVTHLFKDDVGLYDDFLVRSALFGFPDLISVRFLDAQGGKSRIAVYSRSVYGRSDLGVNRARISSWIGELKALISPISS